MSYILEALQKSSDQSAGASLNQTPGVQVSGLALPWKIAIGAILLSNVLFLYLWQSDSSAPDSPISASAPGPSAGNQPATITSNSRAPVIKKTLPGIASPKPLYTETRAAQPNSSSQPTPGQGQTASAAPKTFKPTGAPITIADSPEGLRSSELSVPPAPVELATPGVSQLNELSDSAKQALHVLTFSFHIYSDDAELRAVVVNGTRLKEGSNITVNNGKEFSLLEILETDVIIEFEHEGTTERVQIPVIEDWKDA